MIKTFLAVAFSALFLNNLIFIKFFGIDSFLGLSKKTGIITGLGITVTAILTVSSFLNYIIYKFILLQLNIDFLLTPIFTIVITFVILLLIILIKKSGSLVYEFFGKYLPLIVTNSAILGISLISINLNNDPLTSVLFGFFSGLAYMLGLFIIITIREKLELSEIPGPFKGIPVALITFGIITMIFFAFDSGILDFFK